MDFEQTIDAAERALRGVIRTSPVEHSPMLSDRLGVPVSLKLESLQETGSFKIRGAYFALERMREEGHAKMATCSAGNHGVGVAKAASLCPVR